MSAEQAEAVNAEGVGERNGPSPSPDQARKELEEEFNVQRAKMKELFLQKEEDIRKMLNEKEQLDSEVMSLRAELQQLQTLSENQKSEIQSLQLLVSETVEASSSGTEEVRRLRARNLDLEQQLVQLRQQQQEVSLAPATLVRTLARKLGADAEVEQPTKKNVEENELMQSIIEPLEMEISALKNKLRETDAQLQDTLKAKAVTKETTSISGSSAGDAKPETERLRQCDMCANYEKQLVAEQSQADAARDRATTAERALRQATEELEGVRSVHDETIRTWQQSRSQAQEQLAALQEAAAKAEEEMAQRFKEADQASQRALHHVTMLTVDRETLQRKLDSLERDNAMLMGQYTKRAEEMQNEIIDLPGTVEELQEHTLCLREQLIFCQIGREKAHEAERELRGQLLEHARLFRQQEADLAGLREQLANANEQLEQVALEREQMRELADKLRASTDLTEQLLADKKRLQAEMLELRTRVSALQQELDNSEKVQQDFVRLSQSLQVQLQRLREAESEVRWQHDDDVAECPACRTTLPNNKKKVHCRHCGRIFCGACVAGTVPAGPRRLPARVCAVCRTLLQPHAPPYFSTGPPQDN